MRQSCSTSTILTAACLLTTCLGLACSSSKEAPGKNSVGSGGGGGTAGSGNADPCAAKANIVTRADFDALVAEQCSFLGGDLVIGDVSGLTSLEGLESLTGIVGYISIEENRDLVSLHGLDNVTRAGGLGIGHTYRLASLEGLNSLVRLDLGLGIVQNWALASLSGLDALAELHADLQISGNSVLASLGPLLKWPYNTATEFLNINDNYVLPQCEVERFLDSQTFASCRNCSRNADDGICIGERR